MTAPQSGPRYEYRVQFRRRGWPHLVPRFYQSLPPVRRLVGKLRHPSWDWDHLAPIVELHVQRREVGEWEAITVRSSQIDIDQGRKR